MNTREKIIHYLQLEPKMSIQSTEENVAHALRHAVPVSYAVLTDEIWKKHHQCQPRVRVL